MFRQVLYKALHSLRQIILRRGRVVYYRGVTAATVKAEPRRMIVPPVKGRLYIAVYNNKLVV